MEQIFPSNDNDDMKYPEDNFNVMDLFPPITGNHSPLPHSTQGRMLQQTPLAPIAARSSYPPLSDLSIDQRLMMPTSPALKQDSPQDVVVSPAQLDEDEEDENGREAVNLTSSGRRSRSNVWPPISDPPSIIMRPAVFQNWKIAHTGQESGRNLLVILQGSDGTPRTRYNLQVLRGRPRNYLPAVTHYPACNMMIPGGLTLFELCERYPRHVWGTCLRMFIAEGWTGEQIYAALPADFRDSKAAQRPWNYLQQGFTREVKRMNEEDGLVSQPMCRKRSAAEADLDDSSVSPRLPRPAPSPSMVPMLPPVSRVPVRQGAWAGPALATTRRPVQVYNTPVQQWPRPMPVQRRRSNNIDFDLNFRPRASLSNVHDIPATYDRQAEIGRQDQLLLQIVGMKSGYWFESLANRMARARCARVQILQRIGITYDTATLYQLEGFTEWLEEELQKAKEQANV